MQSQRPHRNQTMSERNSTQHVWVAQFHCVKWHGAKRDALFLLAWSGKHRSCFVAYLSGSKSTLLPRYGQVGWECTVPKRAGFPQIMLKWQVLRCTAIQVVRVHLCAASCWAVQDILCGVSPRWKCLNSMSIPLECFQSRGLLWWTGWPVDFSLWYLLRQNPFVRGEELSIS